MTARNSPFAHELALDVDVWSSERWPFARSGGAGGGLFTHPETALRGAGAPGNAGRIRGVSVLSGRGTLIVEEVYVSLGRQWDKCLDIRGGDYLR
jgi:hypothetical protein